PSITRRAVAFLGVIYGAFQIGQRNVTKRIGAEEFADLLGRAGGGDELFASRRVNAVVARGNRRRAADAHVDFFCADFANHAHDFAAGGAADERVVDEDDALAFEQAADGVEFEFDAEIADGLRGFDEGATDVMIADQAHAERDAGFESVADGGGNAGVRNGDDDVGVNRMLLREQAAECFAALVDAAAEDDAVGAREVDMFEDALLVRFFGREADGFDAAARNADHFSGLDFADVLRVEEVKGAGFAGDQPGIAEFAEIKRAEASRVAYGVEFVGCQDEEGVGAFDLIQGVAQRAGKIASLRACEEVHDDFGVAIGLEDRAAMFEFAAPLGGVGEIAVVAQRDFALVAVDHDRLGVEQRFVSG